MNFFQIYQIFRNFYQVTEAPEHIEPYLLTSRQQSVALQMIGNRHQREALFVHDEEGMCELGLYIDPKIMQRLALHDASPDDFACAVEGISHFLYVIDRISKEKVCTLLELELQGEVDKFLFLHHHALTTHQSFSSLFHDLFKRFSYDETLSREEKERYTEAHHLAAHYCAYLKDRYFHPLRKRELMEEAKTFFHKNFTEKVNYLL